MAYVILEEEKREVKSGKLDLHSMDIEDITEIIGLDTLSQLQVLYLDRNKIKEIKGLKKLKKLRVLELSKNFITEIKGLKALGNLQWLNLRNNQIVEIKELNTLNNLKILNLHNNGIAEIKGLESLANLQEISFSKNRLMEIKGFESCPNLQELDLSNNIISEIKGLDSLIHLTRLSMSGNAIAEIKGLDNPTNLRELVLAGNQITEIIGLSHLAKLRVLDLSDNQITDVKGLGTLTNLRFLNLKDNQIPQKLLVDLGGLDQRGNAKNPQNFVEYCQQRLIRTKEENEKKRNETIQYIKKLPSIYSEIRFEKIISKTGIEANKVESLIENMIFNKEIEAHISGNTLIFKREIRKSIPRPKQLPKSFRSVGKPVSRHIHVMRGGDWKIEGNQSVFNYKVKIKNLSQYIISDVQVIFGDIPPGLELKTDKLIEFSKLRPNSEVAPTYKLYATDNCVGSEVKGIVHYSDHFGRIHTTQIEPFEICYVCNLLAPKSVSREEFDKRIQHMQGKTMHINSSLIPYEIESIVKRNMEECNFALLQEIKEAQDQGFRRIEGLAQGLYDKQDVAISIAMRQLDEGSDIEIKTLSDKFEKTTDLMKDISIKLEGIKSDTQKVQDIIYYFDESKIRETLNIIIEKPKDLKRVIYRVIKNPEWTTEEKDKWAKVVMETLKYYKLFKPPKWKKFLQGITKVVLGESASNAITDGVEELVNWINVKAAKKKMNL